MEAIAIVDSIHTGTLVSHAYIESRAILQPDSYVHDPQPDMTPVEAARIAELFGSIACDRRGMFDVDLFIKKHGLMRHFRKED